MKTAYELAYGVTLDPEAEIAWDGDVVLRKIKAVKR